MGKQTYDAVILGAGPSGLTAAYSLAQQGARALVVERASQPGGLMRGIRRGAFSLDLGRKDLHPDRFPEVHALWTQLLGEDYVAHPRRIGMLYGGRILEEKSGPQGRLRGLSPWQALNVAAGALWAQIQPGPREARSLAEYYRLTYGEPYYEYFTRGFRHKFDGRDPVEQPAPRGAGEIPRFALLRDRLAKRRASRPDTATRKRAGSHHPAYGTQQIVDALWRGAAAGGVEFAFDAEAVALDASGGRVRTVTIRQSGVERTLAAGCAIVGVPAPIVMKMMQPAPPAQLRTPPPEDKAPRKSTALVYLLAEGEPRFGHNWLEVTDPALRMARVVNYARWGGRMVPPGKTALCIEFFSSEGDELMALERDALLELAVSEAAASGLIERARIFDHLVLQLPLANATARHGDWRTAWMVQARSHLCAVQGLLETNRPGMDRACLAGLDAAAACVSGRAMSERSLEEVDDPHTWRPRPGVRIQGYAYGG